MLMHEKTCDRYINWALTRENLSSEVCEQHRRRPASASGQSDQHLCNKLFEKYHPCKLATGEISMF